MLSPARALHFVLSLAVFTLLALITSSPLVVVPTLAVPVPSPMFRNADFAPKPPQNATIAAARDAQPADLLVRDLLSSIESLGAIGSALPRDLEPRQDVSDVISNLNLLNNYYQGMQTHATRFRSLARQPASHRASDFNEQAAGELNAFHIDLLGFRSVLQQLGANKGLANYDKDDELETLLKDLVNSVKYMLSDITDLVYQIPGVGPILGPIVYEIKCILDEVMDAVENLTDAILNAIKPLLEPLIGQATQAACASGLQIAGLCLLL